jgi:hypothetical protein
MMSFPKDVHYIFKPDAGGLTVFCDKALSFFSLRLSQAFTALLISPLAGRPEIGNRHGDVVCQQIGTSAVPQIIDPVRFYREDIGRRET